VQGAFVVQIEGQALGPEGLLLPLCGPRLGLLGPLSQRGHPAVAAAGDEAGLKATGQRPFHHAQAAGGVKGRIGPGVGEGQAKEGQAAGGYGHQGHGFFLPGRN